jgi:hypothetical protein
LARNDSAETVLAKAPRRDAGLSQNRQKGQTDAGPLKVKADMAHIELELPIPFNLSPPLLTPDFFGQPFFHLPPRIP